MAEMPLPPIPDVISKMPWIQLGNFEIASSKTPPPRPYPAQNKPAERAAARFGVHGNAICMNIWFAFYHQWAARLRDMHM